MVGKNAIVDKATVAAAQAHAGHEHLQRVIDFLEGERDVDLDQEMQDAVKALQKAFEAAEELQEELEER